MVIADKCLPDTDLSDELKNIPSVMGRLVWLSSLRSIHSGQYKHPTLGARVSADTLGDMLRTAHERAFSQWLCFTLAEQTADLAFYFSTLPCPRSRIATTWRWLEPYRQFAPECIRAWEKNLFASDLRALLEVLIGNQQIRDRYSGPAVSSVRLIAGLSEREREILLLIGQGKTTKEIAAALSVSCHTVAQHRKKICQKLQAHSTAELITLGYGM